MANSGGEDTSRWMIKTSLQLVASFLTKTSGKDPRRRGEQISRFDSTSSNESVHEAQRGQSRVYEFVTGRNWHKLESQFLPAIWGRKKNVILYSFQRCYSSFVIRDQTLENFFSHSSSSNFDIFSTSPPRRKCAQCSRKIVVGVYYWKKQNSRCSMFHYEERDEEKKEDVQSPSHGEGQGLARNQSMRRDGSRF